MLERKPTLTPDAARQALMKSARRLEPVNDQSGAGLIDAYQALLTVAPAGGQRDAGDFRP